MERNRAVAGPEVHAHALDLRSDRRTFQYTGKDMHEAHKDLHLTSEEFDEVGAEIASALDHFRVPEREKGEVLAAIVARKPEVINP
jgi:truncated hemoglobin YjbI